jgi:hypothetical protein
MRTNTTSDRREYVSMFWPAVQLVVGLVGMALMIAWALYRAWSGGGQ